MKSNREFTDSVYLKYEKALETEKQRTAAKNRTIKYVTALAASIILMAGILGVSFKWNDIFGSDTAIPGNDPVIEQPADTVPGDDESTQQEDPVLGGEENIDDGDTPQAAPPEGSESHEAVDLEDPDTPGAAPPDSSTPVEAIDIDDEDTPTAPAPDASDGDDGSLGYAAIGGGGAVGLGAIAYFLNRRKKRR